MEERRGKLILGVALEVAMTYGLLLACLMSSPYVAYEVGAAVVAAGVPLEEVLPLNRAFTFSR